MLTLAAVALVPGWAGARIAAGFFSVDAAPSLSDGAPNLWAVVQALPWTHDLPLAGLAMATAVGAMAWLAAYFSAHPPRDEKLLPAALLIALVLPGLLPQMQPDGFVLAAGLSVALSVRQRNAAFAALVTGGWLAAMAGSAALGFAPIMVTALLTARTVFASPANDNGLPLNPGRAYPA